MSIFDLFILHYSKLFTLIALIASALILRQFAILSGQYWVKTFSHTATIILLPIITYTITSVISGDIALSLGLVGALSIVRFRNPVKSPFELVIYFTMITCGIAASVSLLWLAFLVFSVTSVLFAIYLVDFTLKKMQKKPYFTTSFIEGNSLNILEITSQSDLDELMNHNTLTNFSRSNDEIIYRLASHDKTLLLTLANKLSKVKTVSHVNFNAA